MNKFLWLAVILTVFNGDANALSSFRTCALHSASNCETPDGFRNEQKQGCAAPETHCRRTFCEAVCTNPEVRSDPNTMSLCVGSCTGITFQDGASLHERLKEILGSAASTERSVGLSVRENALAQTLPHELVKAFQATALDQQKYLFKANQSKATLMQIKAELEATNSNKSTLERLLRTWMKQAAISAGTYNPNVKYTVTTGKEDDADDDDYYDEEATPQGRRSIRGRRTSSRRLSDRSRSVRAY